MKDTNTDIAVMKQDITFTKDQIKYIIENYVTKERYIVVERIAYGLTSLILIAFLTTLIKMVFI